MVKQLNNLANMLMVDDSHPEIALAEGLLKSDRVCVNFFSIRDSYETLPYLRKEKKFADAIAPDIILLDLNMPDMDGRQLLKAIKEDETFCDIPIIIFSGSEAPKDVAETRALGALDYIVKPLSYEKLRNAVKHIPDLEFEESGEQKMLCRTCV